MFARRIAVLAVVAVSLLCTGCPGHEPHIPNEQAAKIISDWLRDEGSPEGDHTFEKGSEKCLGDVRAYSHYGQTEDLFAKIKLTDFPLKIAGKPQTYTGEALVFLRKRKGGEWKVRQMSLTEGDSVHQAFYAKGESIFTSDGHSVIAPHPSATTIAPAATAASETTPAK